MFCQAFISTKTFRQSENLTKLNRRIIIKALRDPGLIPVREVITYYNGILLTTNSVSTNQRPLPTFKALRKTLDSSSPPLM